MANLLTRKLELFGALPSIDRLLLNEIVSQPHQVDAHQDIVREGDSPDDVNLVLDGFACRYKLLPDGSRSIFAYLLPGDFCDLNIFILRAMDHTIATLSVCKMVRIPRERILEMADRPAIARALWWTTLVDEATLREWLVNIGKRRADVRIAHLLCELHLRLKSVGLADGGEFSLPLTQSELADTMGMSPVHMNRSLQALRGDDLVVFKSRQLVIPDIDRLREVAQFNPNYLHLDGGKQDLIPN